jgi:ABC-type transport system involved in cytochrome c biogenesis permease subunit
VEIGTILPFWGATALYGVSLGLYAQWFRAGHADAGKRASVSLWFAALVHFTGLVALGVGRGFGPPTGLGESLSLISLSTILIYLYLEARVHERGLAPFALALVLILMVKASLIGPAVRVEDLLKEHLFGPHATSIILAMSGFTISAFLSIAYLAQYRQLRQKKPGILLRRLPSLQGLDAMTRRATRLGFYALTIGLVTGSLLAHRAWGEYWSWDPKQCMTLLTWMLYGLALILRRRREWQGERIAAVNLVAFSSVVLSVVLLYTVFPTAHRFGVEIS